MCCQSFMLKLRNLKRVARRVDLASFVASTDTPWAIPCFWGASTVRTVVCMQGELRPQRNPWNSSWQKDQPQGEFPVLLSKSTSKSRWLISTQAVNPQWGSKEQTSNRNRAAACNTCIFDHVYCQLLTKAQGAHMHAVPRSYSRWSAVLGLHSLHSPDTGVSPHMWCGSFGFLGGHFQI